MPNLRDRSKIPHKNIFDSVVESKSSSTKKKSKWTIDDKRRLLIFIKRYGLEMILNDTCAFFPHKSSEEINEYLDNIKKKTFPSHYSDYYLSTKTKSSLEIYQETLEELCSKINDHSKIISLALDKIISEEECDESKSVEDPNWKLIYKYISCALSGNRPVPQLKGIDASVVMKLIGELRTYMNSVNIESQRTLLTHKLSIYQQSKQQNEMDNKMSLINKSLLLGSPNENNWKLEKVDSSVVLDVQKEPLYFLNPLNIPVKLLKPQPK